MSLVVQRCRYYYIRARAGDHTPRYLLQNEDPNQGNMTGYEKCVNAINVYLENPNISSEERQIYEDLKNIFIDTMEKLPKTK